ncbi:translin-associated factor X-interacting protein 1 isoform X1 [Sphaerodactylus townsendi]|uniref:translin-associated factor X-interacting protein 1 isoform X1 n=2 Tax=Sphaerodactylus townsendi TaxID=933632 RepID=UPI002025B734|nr:translin-associated factor X-interacting protein 1 isoform X1 [Sphaerodactylus townsendi]
MDRPSLPCWPSSQEFEKRVLFQGSAETLHFEGSATDSKTFQKPRTLESSSSHLSSWPAYTPSSTVLIKGQPCTQPDWRRSIKRQPNFPTSKPRYLEMLEAHLRTELQSLDLTKGRIQELRLQPYREVFEFFMDEFKTYKPLLASIKKEYETTIAHLRDKIYSLESVNAYLATASDKCTEKILAFQRQEKVEIVQLKKERIHLLQLIDQTKEEKSSLEIQVSKLQKAVAEENLRYLNERDARKLLLLDLSEMYRLKEETKLSKIQDEKGEDSVMLTLALKTARQDLTKAQVELNTMKANFGDVVPRRDFESQEKKYNELAEKMMALQEDFKDLQEEYNTVLEVHRQVAEERDQFYNELINVQRNCTPRPEWDKCAEVIAGGPERWTTLSAGKTSDQLVDVLLEDLGAMLLREKDTFTGLGKGDKIPIFLRYDGLVRNKKLTKKEVVSILREIWREKIFVDQQKGKRSSLPEFFLNYFQRKFGDTIAFDWTYSTFEIMKLYRSNEAMSVFFNILTGNLDEVTYHSHLQQLNTLLKELTNVDVGSTGKLTSEQFIIAVKAAFPYKTEEQIQELVDAAGYKPETPEEFILYKLLFLEDEEGTPEPLVLKMKDQHIHEKQGYLHAMQAELGSREVRPDDLRAAFCIVDPGLPDQTLESYITHVFQASKEQLDSAFSLPAETVMQKLASLDLRRQGAPPGEAKGTPLMVEQSSSVF